MRHGFSALLIAGGVIVACGGSDDAKSSNGGNASNDGGGSGGPNGGDAQSTSDGDAGTQPGTDGSTSSGSDGGSGVEPTGVSPVIAGCPMLPANHIFNTPIDKLPPHADSDKYMKTIGTVNIHLDLGMSEDIAKPATYYGIPYNVVHGAALTWASVAYTSQDKKDMTWDPRPESDCAITASHTVTAPCTAANAAAPLLPIPASPLVEGGIFADLSNQAYADHHILLLDADACRLWEVYHAYTGTAGAWDIFGSASWDLKSNALRPADWTSADAAGFPILPLLLRADEAQTGKIQHALRFTIDSSSIRNAYTWPARHLTTNGTNSTDLPQMGQLFRIKSTFQIPSGWDVQSKAIVTALMTYGMYLADGGSNLYIQGEPSMNWSSKILDEVQTIGSDQFEAVDTSPITSRAGFDPNSGAVPP